MSECEHQWIITDWVVNNEKYKRPKKRHCVVCGKTQTISYSGGDLWKWKDEREE